MEEGNEMRHERETEKEREECCKNKERKTLEIRSFWMSCEWNIHMFTIYFSLDMNMSEYERVCERMDVVMWRGVRTEKGILVTAPG